MFVVKISKEKQLLDVKHYIVFQNTLADIANGNVFENISDETLKVGRYALEKDEKQENRL